ncbi:uncharacterized protein BJX67DRAFT_387834 [Aspergillus lucknowensis]|uniref:Transcription factor domain-containing protein n=1 Tax=Aspergillus lucknowensis TaxID=176173 RepID=A0ABR4LST0_9EURO
MVSSGKFQFVSVQGPDGPKDRIQRRQARSHAVKRALEIKRKRERKSRENFRVSVLRTSPEKEVNECKALVGPLVSLSAGTLDPFETLAVDSSRLQSLLGDYKARQAPEPVFSIAEELAFQNFRSVFRASFDDPALLNAVMLSLAFAATGGSIDRECLRYQGQAIAYIREKMSSLSEAASERTIGAILLLAGVEARLGMTSHVQLHMAAVQQVLTLCQEKSIYLTPGIKRAIFWQDLNCSILAGSRRRYDHTTFAELRWTRDPFVPNFFRLPPGFQARSDLLTEGLIEVLQDLHALQCIRQATHYMKGDAMLMMQINNHTASIQSRLMSLPRSSLVQECCHLAAYICSVMLCCTVWCALVIPSHISSQLLRNLQQSNNDSIWSEHPDLLHWLLYIGGAFAPVGTIRSGYITLLRSRHASGLGEWYRSWPALRVTLRRFIYSDKAFDTPVKSLWEEISV